MPNVETLLRDHVTLQVDCIDRLYLNGYVTRLQRPQHVWWYLVEHKGCPVPCPVLLKKWVDSFVGRIRGFAARNRIPLVQFDRHERKEDVARRRLARFRHREGVVFVGVAQEKVNGFRTYQKNRRAHQQRRDGPKSHRYVFTAAGRRIALFLTKTYVRVVRPTLDRVEPQLPDDASDRFRRAWKTCESLFEQVAQEARIAA